MTRRTRLGSAALLAILVAGAARADFTLVTVGDLILSRPVSMLRQPGAFPDAKGFADVLSLLSRGDVTYGNLETTIFDPRSFPGAPYSWDGDWTLVSAPAVAENLRAMRLQLVSRANNHALDWGLEGMRQTDARAAAAGLTAAGAGEDLAAATAPAFLDTPKGRVAIVSMASTFRPTTNALAKSAAAPFGRPGVDGLSVTANTVLDAAGYADVAAIACSFTAVRPCPPPPATLDLFGTTIRETRPGETPFTYDYDMNPDDLDRIADSVTTAKRAARAVVATIHAHEALTDEAPPATWQDPAAFLRTLAHLLIDRGADAFVATGIHHVGGIEIYRGKPIFYGHANFFWSDMQEPLPSDLHSSLANSRLLNDSLVHPERATDADLSNIMNANGSFRIDGDAALNRTFQTIVARSVFDESTGAVKEIRLYPIDLGYGDKLTRSGIPRQARPAIADLVLDRIIALSSEGVAIAKTTENGYVIGVATPK